MDEQKLVVVIMGQDCERFLPMCLGSVISDDKDIAIIYCDGGSKDDSIWIADAECTAVIKNEYNQEDPGMNGKQRNFYLNYLKENYKGWWALVLDADEVVEDIKVIKQWINKFDSITNVYPIFDVKMRHFHNDLGHEDAVSPEHLVLGRLFKVCDDLYYPEVEHPVLNHKTKAKPQGYACRDTTIWHLAHINHCFSIKKRYEKNLKHSNIHSKDYLDNWMKAHLFGTYPNKIVRPEEIPSVILNYFNIEPDSIYFANRGIELKHTIMVKQWDDYFSPKSVLDLGCGRGPYLYFWKWYVPDSFGIELSQWAANNAFVPNVITGDISKEHAYIKSDLITAIDVLEHLTDKQLDDTLHNMVTYGQQFLFSIPFVGDPNLMNDKTHKQFRTKEEWIKLIESYGIKIKETPKDWLFAHQLLVGEKDVNA